MSVVVKKQHSTTALEQWNKVNKNGRDSTAAAAVAVEAEQQWLYFGEEPVSALHHGWQLRVPTAVEQCRLHSSMTLRNVDSDGCDRLALSVREEHDAETYVVHIVYFSTAVARHMCAMENGYDGVKLEMTAGKETKYIAYRVGRDTPLVVYPLGSREGQLFTTQA